MRYIDFGRPIWPILGVVKIQLIRSRHMLLMIQKIVIIFLFKTNK